MFITVNKVLLDQGEGPVEIHTTREVPWDVLGRTEKSVGRAFYRDSYGRLSLYTYETFCTLGYQPIEENGNSVLVAYGKPLCIFSERWNYYSFPTTTNVLADLINAELQEGYVPFVVPANLKRLFLNTSFPYDPNLLEGALLFDGAVFILRAERDSRGITRISCLVPESEPAPSKKELEEEMLGYLSLFADPFPPRKESKAVIKIPATYTEVVVKI